MSLLSCIERGRQSVPPRIVLYGTEGIGNRPTRANVPYPRTIPPATGTSQNIHAGMERQSGHLHGDRIASQTRRGAL